MKNVHTHTHTYTHTNTHTRNEIRKCSDGKLRPPHFLRLSAIDFRCRDLARLFKQLD